MQVMLNASQASLGIKTYDGTAAPFNSVPLDSSRKGYVLSGPQYGTFIKEVKAEIENLLAGLPTAQPPAATLDLEVIGYRETTNIAGSLHFIIKLENAN